MDSYGTLKFMRKQLFQCDRHDDAVLHQQMERMFRNDFNEPLVASKTAMSVEDRRALAQMEGSVKIVNGHYQLGLPWGQKSVRLPNNREFAMTRLNHLKKRFQRDPHLFEKYKETIDCYVSSGFARQVPHEELEVNEDTPVWYLPIIRFSIHKSQVRLESSLTARLSSRAHH